MAIGFDAVSESHTGTTGSASEASFSWDHTPTGTPRGVLVFVFTNSGTDAVSGVTYGGTTVPAVTGGTRSCTTAEPGTCTTFFLGSSVPTGTQSVVVSRTNDASVMYAVAITVTGNSDSAVYESGIVTLGGASTGSLAEQNIDDGSPGTDSMRFAGGNSGLSSVPAAGANSTSLAGIDFGARVCWTVRETTAGQGSRPVGASAGADDRAVVHLAVYETGGGAIARSGTSEGIGSAQGASASEVAATGTSAGVGSATSVPASLNEAAGTATAVGAANGTSEILYFATGTAAGLGVAQAFAAALVNRAGTADGFGSAQAFANPLVSAAGLADGLGSATGYQASLAEASGLAEGIGSATGAVDTGTPNYQTATGTASGVGSASGYVIPMAVGRALGHGWAWGRTPSQDFEIRLSANVAAGGVATTAQLTSPGGTFTSGLLSDAMASLSVDLVEDGYTELEWVLEPAAASSSVTHEFRVLTVETYTAYPEWALQAASSDTATGTASGIGEAVGASVALIETRGTASGVGSAQGASLALVARTGTADGLGTAQGASQSESVQSATGTALGQGSAQGAAQALIARTGTASGIGAATGARAVVWIATGFAEGLGSASGFRTSIHAATGTAPSVGSALAFMAAWAEATGTALATGTAVAEGIEIRPVWNATFGLSGTRSSSTVRSAGPSGVRGVSSSRESRRVPTSLTVEGPPPTEVR